MNSGEVWNLLPSDFQSKVKVVKKLTNNVAAAMSRTRIQPRSRQHQTSCSCSATPRSSRPLTAAGLTISGLATREPVRGVPGQGNEQLFGQLLSWHWQPLVGAIGESVPLLRLPPCQRRRRSVGRPRCGGLVLRLSRFLFLNSCLKARNPARAFLLVMPPRRCRSGSTLWVGIGIRYVWHERSSTY